MLPGANRWPRTGNGYVCCLTTHIAEKHLLKNEEHGAPLTLIMNMIMNSLRWICICKWCGNLHLYCCTNRASLSKSKQSQPPNFLPSQHMKTCAVCALPSWTEDPLFKHSRCRSCPLCDGAVRVKLKNVSFFEEILLNHQDFSLLTTDAQELQNAFLFFSFLGPWH